MHILFSFLLFYFYFSALVGAHTQKKVDRQRMSNSSQMKVTKMLLIVSTVFVLLNLPSYVLRVRAYLSVNEYTCLIRSFSFLFSTFHMVNHSIFLSFFSFAFSPTLNRIVMPAATKCLLYTNTFRNNFLSPTLELTLHYTAWADRIFGKWCFWITQKEAKSWK